MNTYLVIITTVLVITQVIRITQNAVQLHRQNKLIIKELERVGEVTDYDITRQRCVYELLIAYLERKLREMEE